MGAWYGTGTATTWMKPRLLAAGKTYSRNSANMWSLASVDEKLGMVFLPLGNQTPDQWGADRTPGAEKFSAGIVALDLANGKVLELPVHPPRPVDMDVGSQPTLPDQKTADGVKPALIAPTKQGSLRPCWTVVTVHRSYRSTRSRPLKVR